MPGLLDDYMAQQGGGLLGGLSGMSPMLMAAGAGLLGGQGWGGAIQGGMAAQRASSDDAFKRLMLRHSLSKDERDFNLRREQFDFTKQNAGTTDDIKEFNFAKTQGFAGTLEQWMQRKRAGAGEYGLQGIWGVGEDGKPAVMQLGKSGEAIRTKLPEGFQPNKEAQKLDLGTHWGILDPTTRQMVTTIPKDIAGEAKAKKVGEAQGEATVNLPKVEGMATEAIKTIDQIRKHPGKEWGIGVTGIVPPPPGTDVRGFVRLVDQARGQTFLQAFESLKGGGAITETEGTKAEQAIARLDRAQSKEDFDKALSDLEEVIQVGLAKARQKTGASAPAAPAAPQADQGGWRDLGNGVRIREKR
jgi:hypothetical protein